MSRPGGSAQVSRVLVIYYSQSGEVARAAMAFANELEAGGHELTFAPIRPIATYPYPWRSVGRFFDAMPESVLRLPPPVAPLELDADASFDLVVLAYPVWFLSPAPAVQGFLRTSQALALRDTDVLTLTVCRAMWQCASEAMKERLASIGARHVDNVVVTHQGSALATLVSTPRALLLGKRDRLLGVFPQPGASVDDIERVRRLGIAASRALGDERAAGTSLLAGEPAVEVVRWLVVPELLASWIFRGWALAIRRMGSVHPALRRLGVHGFALCLVLLVLLVLPLTLLTTFVLKPLFGTSIDARAVRLAAPTGEAPTRATSVQPVAEG